MTPDQMRRMRLRRMNLLMAYASFASTKAAAEAAFTPLSLFAANEPGGWYDPSDLSTLFQDAAGTTPVTAVEQPVGLVLDKSGNGNHASQSTAAARPVLSARVNALTYTETFSNAAWTKTNTTVSQVSGAVWEVNEGTATGNHLVFQTVSQGLAAFGFAIDVRAGNASPWVRLTSRSNYVTNYLDFNLADQQQINENGTTTAYINPTWTVTPLSDGWYRLQIRSDGAINEAGARALTLAILDSSRNLSHTGISRTIQIRHPQIEAGNQNSTYQRVGAATAGSSTAAGNADYNTTGFPLYLRDDLVDDTLNWTAPAGTYTVAFVDRIGNVTIETSQSLSGTTDVLRVQRLCGYLAIGRALTASETTNLTAWFKSKSGGTA